MKSAITKTCGFHCGRESLHPNQRLDFLLMQKIKKRKRLMTFWETALAIFYLKTIPVSRSKGQSATAGSAYRAGEKITDQRTGLIHDYTKKSGVIETMMFNNFDLTREELWNMSELSNTRKNSRVAREFQVALPHELGNENHKKILIKYSEMLVRRYGVAVDVAIHSPGREGDHRNVHAHIYCTTQVMNTGQLKDKSLLERSDSDLKALGQMVGKRQVKFCRAYWQRCVNSEFRKLGMTERIDHRSNEDRKLSRIPQIHVGPRGTVLARRGRGHESQEWQINEAIKGFNNVVSIEDKRNKRMQTVKNATPEPAVKFGGLAASHEAAEIAYKHVKQQRIRMDQDAEHVESERWKPVQVDPNRSVINMFQQDSQGGYRWTKGRNEGAEAFRDMGKAIHSQTTNSWALAAELELAKSKVDAGEWKEIRAFGSDEYRRAVWIQGQTMGIQVEGYKPTKDELARYNQAPAQGVAGDHKTVEATQNRFQLDPKFQNKFEQKASSANTPASSNSTPSRSPKM